MSQEIDYIGKNFGDITVIKELDPHFTPNGSKQRIVRCQCSCGNIFDARLTYIKNKEKCRKCTSKDLRADITGLRFGRLLVLSMADDYISPSGHRLSRCNCLCDCGNHSIVNMSGLTSGSTKSCGCLKNTVGLLKDNVELMSKYDFDKNAEEGIDINKLAARSNKKVWWKCNKCGNSWLAAISSQNDKIKHGCPYCSGKLVIEGQNDLLSQYPDIAEEWYYEKNGLKPNEVTKKSSVKYWWKCKECGNIWKQTVANRTSGSGCPKCNIENVNSFVEQSVYYYIKQAYPDAINSDMHIGMELDVFIPSRNVAIEYDGEAWHSSKKKTDIDLRKNQLCKENNIELIRIREPKLQDISDCTIFKRADSTTNQSLTNVIINVLKYLGIDNINVDVERDKFNILEQYASKKLENSLAVCFPDVAAEWHPTKNGNLTPDKISKSARLKAWWMCKYGHEWQMVVSDRTRADRVRKDGVIIHAQGCPLCYEQKRNPAVICIETNQYFFNGKEAAKFIGIESPSPIYKCCRGKQKSTSGYHWRFATEDE